MPISLPPISRRRFLGGSLAAATGWMLGRRGLAAEQAVDPHRFALLADTHVWEHRDRENHGVNPAKNFIQARDEILALAPRPSGVIVAGDCVYLEGHAADYAVLRDLVRPMRLAGLPIHFALGNHDNRKHFLAAFPEAAPTAMPSKYVSVLPTPRANWFLLDSLQKTNHTPGLLGKTQLDWLARALDANPDKPALLLAHHDLGKRNGSLQDSDAFLDVITPRKQVKAYFYGHTHRWGCTKQDGIHMVNLPTTAWLFDEKLLRGWVDARLRPGGVDLTVHALDQNHSGHGRQLALTWR